MGGTPQLSLDVGWMIVFYTLAFMFVIVNLILLTALVVMGWPWRRKNP